MKKKTMKQIIEETASRYNLNNRSITEAETCVFTNKDGYHCAVGQYLLPEYKTRGFSMNTLGVASIAELPFSTPPSLKEKISYKLDSFLVKEVRGYPIIFWESLQVFHDGKEHWTKQGLSKEGEKYKQELLTRYS